jgi:hypothetical protein
MVHLSAAPGNRQLFSLRPETFDLLVKTIGERENILETASLHGATPLGGGSEHR